MTLLHGSQKNLQNPANTKKRTGEIENPPVSVYNLFLY